MRAYRVTRGHGSLVETRGRLLDLGRAYQSIVSSLSVTRGLEKGRKGCGKDTDLMEVAKERSRKGVSLGNIHARARYLFSWMDTSTLRDRRRGNSLSTLAISSSRAKSTLLSLKLSERLLTSAHLVAGAFARESRRRTARRAGRSPMWRYKLRSEIGLRNLLTTRREWMSVGQERKANMWSMSSRGRAVSVVRGSSMASGMIDGRRRWHPLLVCTATCMPRPGLRQSPYHLNSHIRHETSAPVAFLFLAVRDGLTRKRGLHMPFPFVPHLPHPISWITSRR